MIKRTAGLISIFILSASLAAAAIDPSAGTTAANFLKLGGGVRSASLGGAGTALADSPAALFWNPAGLSRLAYAELSSTYASWFSEIGYSSFQLAGPLEPGLTAGFALDHVNFGAIEETTLARPGGTGRSFFSYSLVTALALGKQITPAFSLGLTGKYLREEIDLSDLRGYAFDLGALLNISPLLTAGGAVRNLGSFAGLANPLPTDCRLGLAYRPHHSLLLAADASFPNDARSALHFGVEYNFRQLLFCRIGGNNSLGAGLRWLGLKLDYAYVPFGNLGLTHQVSLGLRF